MRSVISVLGVGLFGACSFPDYQVIPVDPLASICTDGKPSAAETGIDCGGGCPPCSVGQSCRNYTDCASQSCVDGSCQPPTCSDGVKNQAETDIDCGGPCSPCQPGGDCKEDEDCAEGVCADAFCQVPTCSDKVENSHETGIDCGGDTCDPCDNGMGCKVDADCKDEHCADDVCVAPRCTDGLLNGSESDLDCGGAECGPCVAGAICGGADDCQSHICKEGECTAYGCSDEVKNGEESDVDCGGGDCSGCGELQHCRDGGDCDSGVCLSGLCVPAAPSDEPLSRQGWSADASNNYPDDNPNQVLDSVGGRWTSGVPQQPGQWFSVDMGKLQAFFKIVLICDEAPADAPSKFDLYLSTDGKYGEPAVSGIYGSSTTTVSFDTARLARYFKIVLTQDKTKWLSLNEVRVSK